MNKNRTKIINLEGSYKMQGSTLVSPERKLLISKRKKTTRRKRTQYLLLQIEKAYTYVSSLYPTKKENKYKLDYQGVNYLLTVDTMSAKISRA